MTVAAGCCGAPKVDWHSRIVRSSTISLIGMGIPMLVAGGVVRAEIIISEIMYNPGGTDLDVNATPPYNREWVEIYNSGAEAVNLAGWSLGDSQDNDLGHALSHAHDPRPPRVAGDHRRRSNVRRPMGRRDQSTAGRYFPFAGQHAVAD